MNDETLQMRSADELRAELEAGLTRRLGSESAAAAAGAKMTPVLEAWLLPALFLTVLLAGAVRPGGEVSVALPRWPRW